MLRQGTFPMPTLGGGVFTAPPISHFFKKFWEKILEKLKNQVNTKAH